MYIATCSSDCCTCRVCDIVMGGKHFSKGKKKGKGKGKGKCKGKGQGKTSEERHAAAMSMCQLFLAFGVPHLIIQLIGMLMISGLVDGASPLDCVEYFAGVQSIVRAFQKYKFNAVAYEITLNDIYFDINSCQGFIVALSLAMRLTPGTYAHLAPVCSTWIWLSRGSTKRKVWDILGQAVTAGGGSSVADANKMISRVCIIVWILAARTIFFTIENPGGTFMRSHSETQYRKHTEKYINPCC